jgi:protein SCO1
MHAGTAGQVLLAFYLFLQPAAAVAQIGGPFTLTGSTGQPVRQADFHGKYLLVFFGYTNCPDLCPATLYKLTRALALLGPGRHIQPVFISVDPVRDTPAIVGRYTRLFSPDIIGLSGTAAQLQAVKERFHVYAGPADPRTGAIAHSALIYILGPDGQFLDALPSDGTAASLARRIARLTAATADPATMSTIPAASAAAPHP